jgi:hypothetical protein
MRDGNVVALWGDLDPPKDRAGGEKGVNTLCRRMKNDARMRTQSISMPHESLFRRRGAGTPQSKMQETQRRWEEEPEAARPEGGGGGVDRDNENPAM